MMENLMPEEENKDIGNLFGLKKELNYTTIKDTRNLFRLEKETKAIKEVWYNCSAHGSVHLFITEISSHNHIKWKQSQKTFL